MATGKTRRPTIRELDVDPAIRERLLSIKVHELYQNRDHPKCLLGTLRRVLCIQITVNLITGLINVFSQTGPQRVVEAGSMGFAVIFLTVGALGVYYRSSRLLLAFIVLCVLNASVSVAVISSSVRDNIHSCEMFDCYDFDSEDNCFSDSEQQCIVDLDEDYCSIQSYRMALTIISIAVSMITGTIPVVVGLLSVIRLEIAKMMLFMPVPSPSASVDQPQGFSTPLLDTIS
eukprot:Rmarinus@m.25494